MRVLQDLLRVGVVVLLGASAWFGFVAGVRRWRPCTGGFETEACMTAQSHETGHLAELAHPEAISLLLLGAAVLLLALLGRIPLWLRLPALVAGPLYWSMGVHELRTVGETEIQPPPPGGFETTPPDAALVAVVFAMPWVMAGVGCVLLARSTDRADRPGLDQLLVVAWFAMALAWPVSEYFLLMFVHASFDAPPGTGLLRSVLAVLAAVAVVWHLVAGHRTSTGGTRGAVRRPRRTASAR